MKAFIAIATLVGLCSWGLLIRPAWRRAHGSAALAAERPSRGLLAGLALALAAVTLGGYAWIGSPEKVNVRPGVPTTPTEQVDALLRELEKRVEQVPDDGQAWSELARGLTAVGRTPEATAAFRRALALRPTDADLLTDFADMLAVQNDRDLSGEPTRLLEQALRADPQHLKALALSGMAAFKREDFAGAVTAWEQLMKILPADNALVVQLREPLEQARVRQASPPKPASAAKPAR